MRRSREAASYAVIQDFIILWETKVHYHVHKSLTMVPTLSQINPVHNMLFYFSKFHFNIILLPTSRYSYFSLFFWLSHQNPIFISLLPMPRTFPVQIILLDMISLIILGEELSSSSLGSFLQPPVNPSLSLVQVFSSTSCSQTLSLYVPPLMSENNYRTHTKPQAKL
jgi:hypothetical protein